MTTPKKFKRCGWFKHDWSRDVHVLFGHSSVALKVCHKCTRVTKSGYNIMGLDDLAPPRIEMARVEILGEGWASE